VRIVVHLDLTADGQVASQHREQYVDKNDANKDFNDMAGYELCHGKELTPPTSPSHCSVGNRIDNNANNPCLTRLEQLTYDEASAACKERGGILANISTVDEALALQKFGDGQNLGIGLRDYGADGDWRFNDGRDARNVVAAFEVAFASNTRRRAANDFRRDGCIMVTSSRHRGPGAERTPACHWW